MLQHWDVPEDPEIVYKKHLKYTKSIVTKIVNRGTYLQHCGGRENDQAFIDEEQKWFSESVSLKKDSKEVTFEVSFALNSWNYSHGQNFSIWVKSKLKNLGVCILRGVLVHT